MNRDLLERRIASELRNTIEVHGPILTADVYKAASRIAVNLIADAEARRFVALEA